MRVVSIVAASTLVVGLAACGAGGGGGPGDLTLGPPTSLPVTTAAAPRTSTTSRPGGGQKVPQVARARFSRLAVYAAPGKPKPARVLVNPWTPAGAPRERIPQVLLVETQRPDGWVKVLLPDTPSPTDGWVRAFDVRIDRVPYRIRVVLGSQRLTLFRGTRALFRGAFGFDRGGVASTRPGAYYLRRVVPGAMWGATASPYVYRVIGSLATRVPLGTPVEILP